MSIKYATGRSIVNYIKEIASAFGSESESKCYSLNDDTGCSLCLLDKCDRYDDISSVLIACVLKRVANFVETKMTHDTSEFIIFKFPLKSFISRLSH